MPTILDVNFGREFLGALQPWKNKAEQFAIKIRHQNSLGHSPAIFLKFAEPKYKIHPKSALRNVGTKNYLLTKQNPPKNVCARSNKAALGATCRTPGHSLGVFQRPLTLILLQKHHDTNGSRIVIHIGVHTTFCQEEGILLQKCRDTNGMCIAMLFKSIGVRSRFDSL